MFSETLIDLKTKMKYRQLTKEQFESLHEEFAKFLASQQIDVKEWQQLKKEKPQVAEEEMNIFSDVVWDDVLTRTEYVEHFSPKTINLFKCNKENIERIVIQVDKDVDLTQKEDYQWLLKNLSDKSIEILTGKKSYNTERNTEIFDIIEKGGIISKGDLFSFFKDFIVKD